MRIRRLLLERGEVRGIRHRGWGLRRPQELSHVTSRVKRISSCDAHEVLIQLALRAHALLLLLVRAG